MGKGRMIDVTPREAEIMVSRGYAERVVETQALSPAETASKPYKPRKRLRKED